MKIKLLIRKPEDLFFVVFLIVIANLLLSFIFSYPIINNGKQLSSNIVSIILIINLFIYYILFVAFINYYSDILKEVISKHKIGSIIIFLSIGLVGMAILSYFTLGMTNTLQWLIPTFATIILTLLFRYIEKNIEKSKSQKGIKTKNKKS